MSLKFNEGTPKEINYNGAAVKKITYDGKIVWPLGPRVELHWTNYNFYTTIPEGVSRLVRIITASEDIEKDLPVTPGARLNIAFLDKHTTVIACENSVFEIRIALSESGTIVFQ